MLDPLSVLLTRMAKKFIQIILQTFNDKATIGHACSRCWDHGGVFSAFELGILEIEVVKGNNTGYFSLYAAVHEPRKRAIDGEVALVGVGDDGGEGDLLATGDLHGERESVGDGGREVEGEEGGVLKGETELGSAEDDPYEEDKEED
ncbi:hypothetical protein LR48_Vigan11g077800 [Vigna angularis]|uniref:Uncharacterized protein n=1 Tax=Phaseolus angularis TaxID=3914 RepID=A0A0L9VRP8_PHAAN|nr:hypothetical protein LR48_Vigan11g077800 [Vigna angularis]